MNPNDNLKADQDYKAIADKLKSAANADMVDELIGELKQLADQGHAKSSRRLGKLY